MVYGEIVAPPELDGSATRRRALFFFAGCFLLRTDGCHVRALQTLELLIAAGLDVSIYSYRAHAAWPWTPADEAACAVLFPTAHLVLDEGGAALAWLGRAKSAVSLLGPRCRRWILRLRLPGLSPALDAIKTGHPPDVAVISYAAGLTALNGLPAATIIVDAHDLTALERVRSDTGELSAGGLLALKKEVGLLAEADGVWCISFAEYWFLKEVLDTPGIRLVPPSVAPGLRGVGGTGEFDLLFIGSDNRWNAEALCRFLSEWAGWARKPTLAVAGKVSMNPDVRAIAEGLPGVHLLGYQADLAELYGRSRATICPVEGTGTKIKMIESLASGRPVFAAPGAVRGLLPGYERCVFGLDEASVMSVLDDPGAMQAAQAAADRYAEAYASDKILLSVKPDLG